MSREELITLLELLQKYKKEEVDSIVKQEPKTKFEFRAFLSANQHKKAINEICECITYDL